MNRIYLLLVILFLNVSAFAGGAPPPTPPANDDPSGATAITVGASCSYTTYTNLNATASTCGTIPAPGCASYSGGDVWFSVVVPAGGALTFDSQTSGITDGGMAVYSGTACGVMTLLGCDDDGSVNGLMPYLSLSGLTAGSTVYIRFWEYGNDNNGTFGLCVSAPSAGTGCTTNTTLYPAATYTPACNGIPEAITTAGYATEYSVVNVVAGTAYTFSSSIATDYLTIANSAGGAPVYASGTTPVTWTATFTGTIRFYNNTNSSCGTNTSIRTRSVQCGTPPPPPANDNCAGAITLTVNPNFMCGTVTPGALSGSTASSDANTCGGTDDDDVWFKFVATGTSHTIDLLNVAGSTTDLYHAVFTGTCGSLGAPILCSDPNNSTLTGLTAGTTYYVRVYSWTSTAGQTSTFNVCIGTPPPPPANDNCSGAVTLTVNADLACGSTTAGSIASATASPDANSCGGTDDDDVWYKFVATSTSHEIDLLNVIGSTTDLYHSVYSGTCGAVGAAILCSDPNSSSLSGLTVGATYYVRVYSWTSTAGQTSSFNICIGTPPPTGVCGNPTSNDYCSDPALLTYNAGSSWTSSTSSLYSSDQPANVSSVFCGSIENNSWYKFTATATSHTFSFSNITNCNNNYGVQAQVYNVTTSGSLCCTNFASVSNCYNPGTNTSGTVTASGLTIGNSYYLMVDGNAGDDCDFTVANWSATGILPIELISFEGFNNGNSNLLKWITGSELNNDYFTLQRSADGINFIDLAVVDGAGNSSTRMDYNSKDNQPLNGYNYYRLKQTDFDGRRSYTNVVTIENKMNEIIVSNVHPNPASSDLNFELFSPLSASYKVQIIDLTGRVVAEDIHEAGPGSNNFSIQLSTLAKGIYSLKVQSMDNEFNSITKIVKN